MSIPPASTAAHSSTPLRACGAGEAGPRWQGSLHGGPARPWPGARDGGPFIEHIRVCAREGSPQPHAAPGLGRARPAPGGMFHGVWGALARPRRRAASGLGRARPAPTPHAADWTTARARPGPIRPAVCCIGARSAGPRRPSAGWTAAYPTVAYSARLPGAHSPGPRRSSASWPGARSTGPSQRARLGVLARPKSPVLPTDAHARLWPGARSPGPYELSGLSRPL